MPHGKATPRFLRNALACAAAIASLPAASLGAQPPQAIEQQRIAVSANRVTYYSDQAIVQARGNVRVRLDDGTTLSGDAFSMDLSLRRFLVVGHVRLTAAGASYAGAAFADFLPFRRMYFVPLDPSADRWTFLKGDYAHPEKGRQMPGDAFFLPDLSGAHPYIVAKRAIIDPATFIALSPAALVFLNGAMQTPELTTDVLNFSDNYYFRVNSLSGAVFDAPYDFAGSDASLSTLHLRYDQQRKFYGSVEQHALWNAGYAVFSLNPATQAAKQWNLLGYDRASPRSALQLQTQLFTVQRGLAEPTSSNGFGDLQFTQTLGHSGVRVDVTQSYMNLLGNGATPNHPITAGISWLGFDEPLLRSGLTYRLTSGISETHDAFGVSGSGHPDVTSDFLALAAYTPVYPAPLGTGINAAYSIQRTYMSFPNKLDQKTFQLSDSKRLTEKFFLVASYVVTSARTDNPALAIVSPNLSTGLVPQPISSNGLPLVLQGLPAATDRLTQLAASFAPSASFQLTLVGQHHDYSPASPAPNPALFGDQVSADVRARISKTLFLDVQRAFIFPSHSFSPQFVVQISSQ